MATTPLRRFFLVVSPVPPLMQPTFLVLLLAAAPIIAMDADRTRDVLTPILTLHLFAASSGFAGQARRGYYDLLLTSGGSRLAIALTHWAFSIAPGVGAWLAIAVLEAAFRGGYPQQALATGSVAAMSIVSMLAWAFTVALPRFSGAIGWVVVVVAGASLWPGGLTAPPGASAAQALQALAMLVNPAVLLGRALEGITVWLVVPAVAAGIVGMVTACGWIAAADYPLESAQ